jgi:hypothetical protein
MAAGAAAEAAPRAASRSKGADGGSGGAPAVNFTAALVPFVKAHDCGRVFTAPYDIVFSSRDVVEPDLLFVSRERLGLLTEANLHRAAGFDFGPALRDQGAGGKADHPGA